MKKPLWVIAGVLIAQLLILLYLFYGLVSSLQSCEKLMPVP